MTPLNELIAKALQQMPKHPRPSTKITAEDVAEWENSAAGINKE